MNRGASSPYAFCANFWYCSKKSGKVCWLGLNDRFSHLHRAVATDCCLTYLRRKPARMSFRCSRVPEC